VNCAICEVCEGTEKHHIIPKSKKGKEVVMVCGSCHDQIHSLFTNKELAKQYNSTESLKTSNRMQNWIEWRKKHPSVVVRHKQSRNKRGYA